MTGPDGVLLVFSKAPVAGKVKRRLVRHLGEEGALQLYMLLLERTLAAASESRFSHVELHCYPSINHPFFRHCESVYGLQLHRQQGRDLGERMYRALSRALRKYPYAVITGCDCPVLTSELLNSVQRQMSSGCRFILGPSEDGGYCLVGAGAAHESLFRDIEWGSDAVLDTTRARLRALGEDWHETYMLWDVDRTEDFRRLQATDPRFRAGG